MAQSSPGVCPTMLTPPCMPMAEALVCLPCNQAIPESQTSQTWWPVSLPPGTGDSRVGTPVLPVAQNPQCHPATETALQALRPQACIHTPDVCTHMHSHMYTWAHPCVFTCACVVCTYACTHAHACVSMSRVPILRVCARTVCALYACTCVQISVHACPSRASPCVPGAHIPQAVPHPQAPA